jgi:hypothetical protein
MPEVKPANRTPASDQTKKLDKTPEAQAAVIKLCALAFAHHCGWLFCSC